MSSGNNEKNLLEILSENDKIAGDKVIDMNSDDVKNKFRVVKKAFDDDPWKIKKIKRRK